MQANFASAAQGEVARGLQPSGLDVVFRPDPTIYDGRFANNAWLQETPKSLTKLTWDNAALISPATAARLTLVSGDVVEREEVTEALEGGELAEREFAIGSGRPMFTAQVSARSAARPGDRVRLAVDPTRIYLFDVDSGELVSGPQAPSAVAPRALVD